MNFHASRNTFPYIFALDKYPLWWVIYILITTMSKPAESSPKGGLLSGFRDQLKMAFSQPIALTTPKRAERTPRRDSHTPEMCTSPTDMGVWDFINFQARNSKPPKS